MKSAAFLILTLVCPSIARGMTWDEPVTPQFVRLHPNTISVNVIEQENGMLAYTVKLRIRPSIKGPLKWTNAKQSLNNSPALLPWLGSATASSSSHYVIERLVVRDKNQTLTEIRKPMFSKDETITYGFSMHRKLAGTSTYTLSVCSVLEQRDQPPIPIPGTINYIVQLSEFTSSDMSE